MHISLNGPRVSLAAMKSPAIEQSTPEPQKTDAEPLATPPAPPSMRAKTREAVTLIIEHGITQREAARRAGMNEKSLSRALKRRDIAEYVEAEKAMFAAGLDRLRDHAKALALRRAMHLMHHASSEAVQVKMVELLAGERPDSGPAVQVNVTQTGGYEYPPKGARLVDITPMDQGDDAMSAPNSQENKGHGSQ